MSHYLAHLGEHDHIDPSYQIASQMHISTEIISMSSNVFLFLSKRTLLVKFKLTCVPKVHKKSNSKTEMFSMVPRQGFLHTCPFAQVGKKSTRTANVLHLL